MKPLNLFPVGLPFGTFLPNNIPLFALVVRTIVDDLKHVFSGVLLFAAGSSTVRLEVLEQRARVLSNVTEVNGLTTLGQEQQAVERLEENSAGLMDGAENSLPRVSELTQERADRPRALRVKSTGRLIKEEKQLGLSSELDTDGQQLALFNVETFSWDSNDGIGKVFHVQHLDDVLDKVVLFLLADSLWLAKHCTKTQAFTNSGSFQMQVCWWVSAEL
jgi:hypothetical protein